MSAPENWFSRWSRLKRDPASQKTSVEEPRLAEPTPQAHLPATPVVDPTNLPPIDSIVADSDIRQFLQAGVPAELTRAALRAAWTADPDIRGFIGIADNQWDFNSEGAIPGFGALTAADYESSLLAAVRPSRTAAAAGTPESLGSMDVAMPTNADVESTAATDELCPLATLPDRSSHSDDTTAAISTDTAENDPVSRPSVKHSHGGALPK
jgi:hypothetical protein